MASFVFALVRGHLAGGGKGEAAALAYAVEMVGGFAVDAAFVLAFLVFVKLLEAVLGVSVIFDVIALVLLYVTLVLEGEGTAGAPEAGKIDGLNCKSYNYVLSSKRSLHTSIHLQWKWVVFCP